MGLFDFLKKNNHKRFDYDKAAWQWETCCTEYCKEKGKSMDQLDEKEEDLIWEYSSGYHSFFLTWCILHDFLSTEWKSTCKDITLVKEEKMTGTAFFGKHLDYVLSRDDLSEEILDFVDDYYQEKLITDYGHFVEEELHENLFLFPFSWEAYHQFEPILDQAYQSFQKIKANKKIGS